MKPKSIRLFIKPWCGWCHEAADWLTTQGIPYYGALVAIELEKAQTAAGKPYGRANMKFLRRLSPDEQARAVEFHQMCQQFAGRVHTGTAADAAE